MSERREASRQRVYIGGRIVHRCIRSDTSCLLRNMSSGGARVAVSGAIPLPGHFDIVIDCRGTTRPVEIVWRKGDEMGVRFVARTAQQDDVTGLWNRFEQSKIKSTQVRAQISGAELHMRLPEDALH